MSTAKGFQGWGTPEAQGDEKLLRFLWRHKHMTPFEFGGMTIEVKAPIMVFREWHRHRTQSYNEMSARYTPLPDENYVPTVERLLFRSEKNKQAQSTGGTTLSTEQAEAFRLKVSGLYEELESAYQRALADGVPKELARIILPVGRYSKMRASANLRNWLAFLTLRMDEAAQWEIRAYANEVAKLVAYYFPRTYELFSEGLKQPEGTK
jgi:thymidylate synthase (FAD)